MKFSEAKQIIKDNSGYRVTFEHRHNGILTSDFFPDRDEGTIPTEEEAWGWAEKFADAVDDATYVNIYVIHGHDYSPVKGYQQKRLHSYCVGL